MFCLLCVASGCYFKTLAGCLKQLCRGVSRPSWKMLLSALWTHAFCLVMPPTALLAHETRRKQSLGPGEVSDSSGDSDADAGSSSDEEILQDGPWIPNSMKLLAGITKRRKWTMAVIRACLRPMVLWHCPAQALGALRCAPLIPFWKGICIVTIQGALVPSPSALRIEIPTLGEIMFAGCVFHFSCCLYSHCSLNAQL